MIHLKKNRCPICLKRIENFSKIKPNNIAMNFVGNLTLLEILNLSVDEKELEIPDEKAPTSLRLCNINFNTK